MSPRHLNVHVGAAGDTINPCRVGLSSALPTGQGAAGTISVDRTTLHEPTLHETRASGAPRLLAHVRAGLRLLALLSTSGARCFCSSHSLALRHSNQSSRDGPVRRMHDQADESHAARAVQMEFATKHAFARPRFPPSQCWAGLRATSTGRHKVSLVETCENRRENGERRTSRFVGKRR